MQRERNSAASKLQTYARTLNEKDPNIYQSEIAALLNLAGRIGDSGSADRGGGLK